MFPFLRSRDRIRAQGVRALMAGAAFTALGASCDNNAQFIPNRVSFDNIQVLGATPVKKVTTKAGGTLFEPACGGDATHVRVDFNLISTARKPRDDGFVDRDRQIREGLDVVDDKQIIIGSTVNVEDFDLSVNCISSHSGGDQGGNCAGSDPSDTVDASGLVYVDRVNGEPRGTSIGVAILVDQSGSTLGAGDGLVPAGALRPTCIEGKPDAYDAASLQDCASDSEELRLQAAKTLLKDLNSNDRSIVFQFNEDVGVKIVCDADAPAATEEQKGKECYTTRREKFFGGLVDDDFYIDQLSDQVLGSRGVGRSNLWSALDLGFDYMKLQGEVARHIVVVTDGTDTCTAESTDFQHCFTNNGAGEGPTAQSPCASAVSFNALRTKVEAYIAERRANQQPNDLHLSFVHFQSPGYPEHDARMQQLACLTGGNYTFINSNRLSSERAEVMTEAMTRLRYSLSGHWGVVTGISEYTADPVTSAAASPKGDDYALAGQLTLKKDVVTKTDEIVPFIFDGNLDGRLPVVRPCQADADCGTGAGAVCGIRCDPESKLCIAPAQGSPCGVGNVCCAGDCVTQPVCVDPDDPRSCP